MARTNVVNSATGQFFINLINNDFLNHRQFFKPVLAMLFLVKSTEGMDVVDGIGKTRTHAYGMFRDVPID